MKVKPCPLPYRILSAFLAVLVPATSLPPQLWAATPDPVSVAINNPSEESGPARIVNAPAIRPAWRLPVTQAVFKALPEFSSTPTDQEFAAVRALEQELLPVGVTTAAENKLLAAAITKYLQRSERADQSALLGFLEQFPNSAWKPALLVNLGIAWRQTGFFTKALNAWQEAWTLTKNAQDLPAKTIADRAGAEFLQANAWVGRYQVIEPFLKEVATRQFSPAAAATVISVSEGLWLMKNHPEKSFSCGPYAIREILSRTKPNLDAAKVMEAKPSGHGFNLTEVATLARQHGLNYQMAKRKPGAAIPLNSVIHWKLDHYGAVIKEENGKYLIQDSTFAFRYGEKLWVSKAALEEECSGYFLIPAGPLAAGWTAVSAAEGAKVWGRGATSGRPGSATNCGDEKSCNNCNAKGMAKSSVHLMLASVNIVDIPVWHDPPKGPAVSFRVTYNQSEGAPTKMLNYGNLGPNWTHDYFSYIQEGLDGDRDEVTRHSAGGGSITHVGYVSASGLYTIDRFGGILQYVPPSGATPDRYELLYADDSKLVYEHADTVAGARRLLMTKQVDAAGNEVTIVYGDANFPWRITHINDALGQSTELFYEHPTDNKKITSVAEPFGRRAYFNYDFAGRLVSITDMGGLVSSFTYDNASSGSIATMTTPYGPTTFTTTQGVGQYARTLLVTDPNGDREYFVSDHDDRGVAFDPNQNPDSTPNAGDLGSVSFITATPARNTYYFDKKVMSATPNLNALNYNDASIYHWFHGHEGGSSVTSPLLESVKKPGQSWVFFRYPGQTDATDDAGITLGQPNIVAQVVENPAGGYLTEIQRYEYNAIGNVSKSTDPLGRVTEIDYYAGGRDVQKVRRVVNGGTTSEVLGELGAYNAQRRPTSYTDAARQVTQFQWNSAGQLTQVTNPKSEVTRLVYAANGDGYLQSVQQDWAGGTKTTTLGYDGYERVRTVTGSDNYAMIYDYDELDRILQVTYPDNRYESYQYDRLDLAVSWDREGRRTKMTYDNAGRLLTVKDRLNRLTRFGWCGCGGLDSLTDPLGRVTTWARDIAGRVTDKVYDDNKIIHYSYQGFSGRLASITDAENQTKNYSYNLDGSLKGIAYANETVATPDVSLTYDPERRRMLTLTDGTGTTTFGYHDITTAGALGAGRLASIDGPLANDTITFGYDPLGRVLNKAINGTGESVTLDTLGRLATHVTPQGTFTPGYVGDTSRLASFAYPNNQTTTFDYYTGASDFRLKQIWHKKSGGATLSKFDYAYDAQGRIRQWTQQADAATPQVMTLDYDIEDQLLNAVLTPNNGGSPTKAFAYKYDGMGNRLSEQRDTFTPSQSSTVTSGTFNDVNQLTGQNAPGPVAVQFKGKVNEPATVTVNGQSAQVLPDQDSATGGRTFNATLTLPAGNNTVAVVAKDFGAGSGNTTTKNYSVAVAAGAAKAFAYDDNGNCTANGSVTYEWDAEDRLVALNNGALRSEFTYDGFGRRVKLVEMNNGTVTSTKRFIWIGTQIAEERDGANNVTKRFYAEGAIHYQPSTINYFYTRDHLGSIREVTDGVGNVLARYDYDPYGRRTLVSGMDLADFGYTGHYVHKPSGLHLAVYRAYDADLGRWLNQDPIEEDGGINLYGYVENDAINQVDLMGLQKGPPPPRPTPGVRPVIRHPDDGRAIYPPGLRNPTRANQAAGNLLQFLKKNGLLDRDRAKCPSLEDDYYYKYGPSGWHMRTIYFPDGRELNVFSYTPPYTPPTRPIPPIPAAFYPAVPPSYPISGNAPPSSLERPL